MDPANYPSASSPNRPSSPATPRQQAAADAAKFGTEVYYVAAAGAAEVESSGPGRRVIEVADMVAEEVPMMDRSASRGGCCPRLSEVLKAIITHPFVIHFSSLSFIASYVTFMSFAIAFGKDIGGLKPTECNLNGDCATSCGLELYAYIATAIGGLMGLPAVILFMTGNIMSCFPKLYVPPTENRCAPKGHVAEFYALTHPFAGAVLALLATVPFSAIVASMPMTIRAEEKDNAAKSCYEGFSEDKSFLYSSTLIPTACAMFVSLVLALSYFIVGMQEQKSCAIRYERI